MIIKAIKNSIKSLNPLAIFYFFAATSVVVRGVIFWALVYGHQPAVYLRGWHLHHFSFGFLFLALALWASANDEFPRWLLEIIFGISLGLIFDEFIFWTMHRFDYWSLGNFYALSFFAAASVLMALRISEPYQINIRGDKEDKVFTKKQALVPMIMFIIIMFMFFTFNGADNAQASEPKVQSIKHGISNEDSKWENFFQAKWHGKE